MSRPSFETICMNLALSISERSTCARLNVGCVIASHDYRKILAWGYNGNATGLPNKCDSTEPGKCGCIHAEQNAVINCDSPRDTKKIIFCTNQPCAMCAKFIVNLGGVQQVYYARPYRLTEGLDVLAMAGIPVRHTPLVEEVCDHSSHQNPGLLTGCPACEGLDSDTGELGCPRSGEDV